MNERDIFISALEIGDPEARRAHLQSACGEDADLLRRVESLLASHEVQSRFLETPVVEQLAHPPRQGTAATIVVEKDSTRDESADADASVFLGKGPVSANQENPADEIPLGYLQPPTRPDALGRLSHYEILQILGHGAFGTVFKAFDDKLQRVVAIKVMAPELAATSPARKRFLREARASAAIRHEYVVSVYAVEETPIPYLVMEYVPGQTLQQRLDERGPLEVPDVLRLGTQIAEGLAAAHAKYLIHRDIKPGNILLETGIHERVKITDFGLARAADDASMTQSGMIAGTPLYMAPEQALGQKLDQRADLFSFGSVLYQMVSGRPPFRAPTTLAVLKRVAEETPRPIAEIIPETPAWLCDIISKLHAKNPDYRYQSAREIADVLANCEAQLKAQSEPKELSPIPRTKPRHTRTWKWAAAMVLVLPLVAYGAYTLTQWLQRSAVSVQDVTRNNENTKPLAKVVGPAPPPAQKAKEHQEAWAKHLGVPVEITNSIGMKLVLIPPGEFEMGSPQELIDEELRTAPKDDKWYLEHLPGEGPRHHVRITQPFYLGMYLVTQEEYQRVMGTNPSEFSATGKSKDVVAGQDTKRFPVEMVSWNNAYGFCSRLSDMAEEKAASRRYQLPSEAQWEYACRADTTGRNFFVTASTALEEKQDADRLLPEFAWFAGNAGGQPHAVGGHRANPWGLYDMNGNVWEWCQDWYDKDYYSKSPADDPVGPTSGSDRVHRGGAWSYPARGSRSAYRYEYQPGVRFNRLGFRVSQVLADTVIDRAKMSRVTDAAQPSRESAANQPSPATTFVPPANSSPLHSIQWVAEKGISAQIWQPGVSADGKFFFGAGDAGPTGAIRIFEVATGQEVQELRPGRNVWFSFAAFVPGGKYLAAGYNQDKDLYLWDIATGDVVRKFVGHTDVDNQFAVSPDGKQLLSWGIKDQTLRLWDVETGKERKKLEGHTGGAQGVFSPDGKKILSFGAGKTLCLWDADSGEVLKKLEGHDDAVTALFSPDGKQVLSSSRDQTIRLWDVETGNEIRRFEGPLPNVYRVYFVAGGRQVVATCDDGTFRVWETVSGKLQREIELSEAGEDSGSISASPNGRLGLASQSDGSVRVYDLTSGKEIHRYTGCPKANGFSFTLDGNFAVAGSHRTGLYVFQLPNAN